jgi:glyoxalase-like protein
MAKLDHLLLGVDDLDRGIAWFAELTGVTAGVGGSHPGRGTRNALAALGGQRYLEIIAPDPAQPADNLRLNLRSLREPRPITWAAATSDIDTLAKRIHEQFHLDAIPQDGSRARPDGRVLKWRTLAIQSDFAESVVNPIPFFIEWGQGSVHPSHDAPIGCDLTAFEFEHPNAKRLEATLAALGITGIVRPAPMVRLVATIDTPKGRIVLT